MTEDRGRLGLRRGLFIWGATFTALYLLSRQVQIAAALSVIDRPVRTIALLAIGELGGHVLMALAVAALVAVFAAYLAGTPARLPFRDSLGAVLAGHVPKSMVTSTHRRLRAG